MSIAPLVEACHKLFDTSPQSFCLAYVHVDEAGKPYDFSYEYLNEAMAVLGEQTVEEALGRKAYEMWGGDTTWLDHFHHAAYHDEPCEFEAVSVLFEQFLHVIAFPVGQQGYCGFMIQDVAKWIPQSDVAEGDVAAELFFYDLRTSLVMMTPSACKIYGLSKAYSSLEAMARELFADDHGTEVQHLAQMFKNGEGGLPFEGKSRQGRWLRLGISHLGTTETFGLGIIEDITRVKEAEEASAQHMQQLQRQKVALEDALKLAEHASSAKSTFLTNMSHDFRTPMNSITGFASLALQNLDDTDRVRDCLEKITLSSNHLLDLVSDILDMSRIESGKMALDERPLDLVALMERIETMFTVQAAERGMDFSMGMTGVKDSRVFGDELRLTQILVNIIGNAFKFTDDGGKVEVRVVQRQGAARGYGRYAIQVRDTGCGMKPGFEETIFTPFGREGAGLARRKEGTGLGMAITKNLVDLMGGTIQVTSTLGVGSEFIVTLPLRLDDAAQRAADAQEAAAADGRVDEARFDGKCALVVDDDELSRELMCEILKQRGFTVEVADDGAEAVCLVGGSDVGHYDVVMMDMRMGDMDGDEATRLIRAMDRPDANLPIIAVTADAFEESTRRAAAAGMTARATKPVNMRELVGILQEHLGQA